MRVAIRCIYQKAVTPSCDIVYMDKETWDRFRFEIHNRRQIALKLLGKEQMDTYIKEIVWIPLSSFALSSILWARSQLHQMI